MFYLSELIGKSIRDHQGNPVARIRDLVAEVASNVSLISEDDTEQPVVCVDVGIGGLVRRLRLARLAERINSKILQPHIVRWQHLDVFGSNVPGGVALPHSKLAKLHPVEIARITDSVSYLQGAEIIASLDDTLAADTLEEIVAERQTDIMEIIPDERAADILEEMAPDEATDLLAELPEEKATALLEQ